MLFLTHLLVGILIALLSKPFFSGGVFLLFFFLVLLGSILPDIDEENSKINKWSGIIGKVFSFLSKHRGFFHSFIFVVALTLVVKIFFSNYYAWALFLGMFGHLLADSLTKQGINFSYPFKGWEVRGWIKTGGILERVFQVLVLGLIIVNLIIY